MKVEAGKREKGDVYVTIEESDGREVTVKSKLMVLYGDAIRKTVEEMTSHLSGVRITVEDFGALDFVLRARLEATLRKLGGEEE